MAFSKFIYIYPSDYQLLIETLTFMSVHFVTSVDVSGVARDTGEVTMLAVYLQALSEPPCDEVADLCHVLSAIGRQHHGRRPRLLK